MPEPARAAAFRDEYLDPSSISLELHFPVNSNQIGVKGNCLGENASLSMGGASEAAPAHLSTDLSAQLHVVMGVVHEPSDASDFDQLISDNSGKLIVVDFYATWCGPCKIMAPKFHKMASEFPDVVLAKVDVDEAEDIVSRFDIKVMPTFIFLRNGVQVDIVEGSVEDQLKSKIAKHQ